MGKKIIFSAIALSLIALGSFKLYSNKVEINEAATYVEELGNIPVQVLTVQPQKQAQSLSYTGTFNPYREVQLGAELQGKIVKSYVSEGQYLSAGKPIAKIDDRILSLQLKSQQNQLAISTINTQNQQVLLAKTQTDLQRFENLKNEDAVADITYQNQKLNLTQVQGGLDANKLGLEGANIAIETTQAQLNKTLIKAPISGYLTTKQFEVGSIVAPGAPLGIITDISRLKLTTMVPERHIMAFTVGQTVSIEADIFPGVSFQGTISQIAAKGDAKHHFKVVVLLDNNDKQHPLKAGMYGKLILSGVSHSESILVPSTVLLGSSNQIQVYVVEEGKAVLRNVQTGASNGDEIEITAGLQAGDQIISSGMNRLSHGLTVKIID